jgi:hypothetical protein
MESDKSLNKIKKLKPTNAGVIVKHKKSSLYKTISSMYEKDYNLKIDKKN